MYRLLRTSQWRYYFAANFLYVDLHCSLQNLISSRQRSRFLRRSKERPHCRQGLLGRLLLFGFLVVVFLAIVWDEMNYRNHLMTVLRDLVLDLRFFSAIRASIACWGGVVILRGALGGLNALCIIVESFLRSTSLFISWVLWTCESILNTHSSVRNEP